MRDDPDVQRVADVFHEVVCSHLRQGIAPDYDVYFAGKLGHIQCGLAGRVAAADNINWFVAACVRCNKDAAP